MGIHPFNPERVIATITRANATPEAQQVRTPTSARSVRRLFNQLQKEGYVTAEALPLLYASEKLATKNEILRHEIQGLRNAMTEEKKKKRKRRKAMGLREKGENPGQPLFCSPSRVRRARQQAADEVEAERQRKQAIQVRKLQAAKRRAEKAREVEERKAARVAAREAAKAEQGRRKTKQAANKAAQQASKLAKATGQRQGTTVGKDQRIVIEEAKANAAKPRKGRLVEEEVVMPRKRPCVKLLTQRIKQRASDVRIVLSSPEHELQSDLVWKANNTGSASRQRDEGGMLVSQRLRSGRTTQPPLRYM